MYLGLDIGTSAVKAVAVSEEGVVTASASAPLRSSHPHSGWSEQNPDDWCAAVAEAVSNLAKKAKLASAKAIGLSGQMHGAVLLDAAKTVLRPSILWNDGRAAPQCAAINASVPDLETRAGISAMPGFTAPKLRWVAEHEPEVHGRIAHVLLPKDYVRFWLTGTLATDMADAAGTLWLDQATRRWDKTLCEASRTEIDWLPTLLEGTQVSGTLRDSIADQLGLPTGIPIAAGGGDAATGALGIGAISEGDAFISLGTSGQLFVANERYRPAPGTAIHAYAHCVPERWFQMAAMLNGASPMAWLAGILGKEVGTMLNEAESASKAPLFLPYLTGERTPHNDAHIRGAFYDLAPDTGAPEMARGVVNAIAWTFCDALDRVREAGTTIEQVAAIGGGSRSDFLLQTMADAMGIVIHRYADAETGPALGAARLAMVASGGATLENVATRPELDRSFTPNGANAVFHAENLPRWRELYRVLKPFAAA